MAAAGITLVKLFTYRGNAEEWSNTYHLSGAPLDRAGWVSLATAMADLESPCYTSAVHVKRALCYDDTDHDALYTLHYDGTDMGAVVGTALGTGGDSPAGDQAGVVSWNTGLRGSTGKPIWLRKYFHDVWVSDTHGEGDYITSEFVDNLTTFGNTLLTSAIDAGIVFADKNGRAPDGPIRVDEFITTRTLKRRGKRP